MNNLQSRASFVPLLTSSIFFLYNFNFLFLLFFPSPIWHWVSPGLFFCPFLSRVKEMDCLSCYFFVGKFYWNKLLSMPPFTSLSGHPWAMNLLGSCLMCSHCCSLAHVGANLHTASSHWHLLESQILVKRPWRTPAFLQASAMSYVHMREEKSSKSHPDLRWCIIRSVTH